MSLREQNNVNISPTIKTKLEGFNSSDKENDNENSTENLMELLVKPVTELTDKQKLLVKKTKNRLAAKKSREKKSVQIKQMEIKNRQMYNDIQFSIEAIFEYDSICGALLSFLELLVMDDKIDSGNIERLKNYFADVKSKGMKNVSVFLNQPMQMNNERLADFLDNLALKIKSKNGE